MFEPKDNLLFASGEIYLLSEPIDGRLGVGTLFSQLTNGFLIGEYHMQEVWIAGLTRTRTSLIILHVDRYGYSKCVRKLHRAGRFKAVLDGTVTINRSQLRRLCTDGTFNTKWNSQIIKQNIEQHGLQPQPSALK